MSMSKVSIEEEFEDQLRQQELVEKAKEDGKALTRGTSYVDEDGTVMEWDHERRAYFPKIDSDFIAQYQVNYGASTTESGQELTEEEKQAQYNAYWENYYKVCMQQQPKMPKLDVEGNEVEDEEGRKENSHKKDEKEKKKKKDSDKEEEQSQEESNWNSDPTSDEHYQYNLYYYGQEYADAYRDYYREHPDEAPMPDFVKESKTLGDKEASVVKAKEDKEKKKKEKAEKRKEPPKDQGWFDVDSEQSTHVYISGMPGDITDEEYKELVSKCGLIMFDPVTKKPKLRLYTDEDGKPKGDGLCTYIKQESVELALNILDGSDLRGHKLKVERAKFEMKGNYDPAKKKKKLTNKEKNRLKERQQKLFDWRPDKNPFERQRHERIVILKNMFDIAEFDTNPALINEFRADVREECSKFGEVKKVVLYDRNPEGVISVTFKEPEEADQCITSLNGRWFAKRRVTAETHDGKTKYDVKETDEEKEKRLKDWENFLEGKSESKSQPRAESTPETTAKTATEDTSGSQTTATSDPSKTDNASEGSSSAS